MNKFEHSSPAELSSTLWSRRKFLRVSAAAVLGAGFTAVERGVLAAAATIESPSQKNPFSRLSNAQSAEVGSGSGTGRRWQLSAERGGLTQKEISVSEVEQEMLRLISSDEKNTSSSEVSSGGVINPEAARVAIREQAAGVTGFLNELTKSPSAVLWTGRFAEGTQPGVQLNPLVDRTSGSVLFLIQSQSGQKEQLESQLLMPNYLRPAAEKLRGFQWLSPNAIDRTGTGRFIPINSDPSKYQFRVKQTKGGWNIERDTLDAKGGVLKTERYNPIEETVESVSKSADAPSLEEVLQWNGEQVKEFLGQVIPLKFSNEKTVPWGIIKTSTELNGDEFMLGAAYHSYGKEKVAAKNKAGKEFSADLHFLNLLVPNAKQTKLVPVKFYLYQNMETTGIIGYTSLDPLKQRVPAERGGSGSASAKPLLMTNFDEMEFGTFLGILSPAAGIVYSDEQYESYYSRLPEAVVALMRNGKESASFKKAQEMLRKEESAQVFGAEWLYLSNRGLRN